PFIPQEQKDLTNEVSKYEIKLLDNIGSLYFSRDSYDSYSLGTGDVYPDALGSIAMLFEQPSARGMQQESANGVLNFQFTVRNQVMCAFGAVEAGYRMKDTLNDFMKRFVKNSYANAKKQSVKGWVFDGNGSDAISWHFIEMLRHHGLQAYKLAKNYTQDGYTYKAANSYIVPAEQKHSVLLNSLFDTNKNFVDSLFYDISTWNLAEAYGLKYSNVKSTAGLIGDLANGVQSDGSVTEMTPFPKGGIIGGKSTMAYIFDNREFYVPYVVNGLQQKGIRVMVARLGAKAEGSDIQHGAGSYIVPVANQDVDADTIYNTLLKLATEAGVMVESVSSSRMSDYDLGHYTNKVLRKPEVAILGNAGVPWYILNYRMQMTPTLLDASGTADLSRYNVLIMTGGVSNKAMQDRIAEWVRAGGTLITIGGGYRSANDMGLTDIKVKDMERAPSDKYVNFADRADYNSTFSIPGTDLLVQMDYSHPLCWGYDSPMPVIKQSTVVFEMPRDVNSAPAWYDKSDPLLSGFLRPAHKESLKGAPEVICTRAGSGVVISFADDINFRSTWLGGTRMFMNAIFFGNLTTGR
ncbi:MAG: hypothetical protein J6Z27_02065, partial [Bacteroidales bacterium]|nr:hypothetical protein [Bacteroidales bacterium]